jgi:UDP-glucuronate 4-epimerase
MAKMLYMTQQANHKILVTGVAGFIGMHTAIRLLSMGYQVVGCDSLVDYYDVALKHARLANIVAYVKKSGLASTAFEFTQLDIADTQAVMQTYATQSLTSIVHLAAQAGVRYSVQNPHAYAQANLVGMTNILELARATKAAHMVYASSSSVYGGNTKVPFSEDDRVDQPVSFYAATKRANEAMAYSYSKLFDLPITGLRFFTVYGPWGRPDMAPWLFTQAAITGAEISVFGEGLLRRDFTFIDDIVEGVVRVMQRPMNSAEGVPHQLFNIGNNAPNTVNELVAAIENATGQTLKKVFKPMPLGDVPATFADISRLQAYTGFHPSTTLAQGIAQFVHWYRGYHVVLS